MSEWGAFLDNILEYNDFMKKNFPKTQQQANRDKETIGIFRSHIRA